MNRVQRALLGLLLGALLVPAFPWERALAVQSAGAQISDTSTATFSDQYSNNYSASSNTLSIYVQNAPVLTIGNLSGENVTPADVQVDSFTLTNTGNNSGTFALSADAAFGGTATGTTLMGYVLAGPPGTCTTATPCALAILNAQNAMAVGQGVGVTIGVEFQVSSSATLNQTVQPSITANIAYAAGTGTSQNTSSNLSNTTYSDTLTADARLDIQASATTPGTSGANITWTITANNGGGQIAQGLASAKTVFGAANNGIAIFMPMPVYGSALAIQSLPSTPTLSGGSSGAVAAVYYNPAACSSHPTINWTTTAWNTAVCIAVYVSNSTASVLPSATGGSAGAGSVSAPQISYSFITNQPSGSGSANANSVTLIASSAVGGLSWVTTAVPILGQGLAVGTSQDAATASLLNGIQSNTTASSGIIAPGGASNSIGRAAFAFNSVSIGPYGQAQATGAWSGSTNPGYTTGTANSSNDFSFFDYDSSAPSINSATNPALAPSGNSIANSGAATIDGTILNAGNLSDSFNLTAGSVTNWTSTFQCYNAVAAACGVGDLQFACHVGNITVTPTVAATATYNFCATFTPSANVTTLSALAWLITATSVGSSGVNNTTYDVLYPGGVLVAFRSNAVSGPGTCSTVLVSGCTITYTVTLVNEAPIVAAGGGANNVSVTPTSTAVITENAAAPGNNWGAYTNGLTGVPTFISCTGCTTTGVATSKNFTVTIPSSDLAPQATATYSYAVVVN